MRHLESVRLEQAETDEDKGVGTLNYSTAYIRGKCLAVDLVNIKGIRPSGPGQTCNFSVVVEVYPAATDALCLAMKSLVYPKCTERIFDLQLQEGEEDKHKFFFNLTEDAAAVIVFQGLGFTK
jgi:hypothetical protein